MKYSQNHGARANETPQRPQPIYVFCCHVLCVWRVRFVGLSVFGGTMKRVLYILPYALIALAVVIVVVYLNNEAAQMTAGAYYDR